MDSQKKSRIIAFISAITIHVLILLITFFVAIEHTSAEMDDAEWPPRDSSEILFGGEYVMLGDMIQPEVVTNQEQPAPSNEEVETVEADDLSNSGPQGQPSQVVTSTQESPMKVEPKPETAPGPTKEELEAAEKARIEKEKQEQIKNQMANAFASKSKNTDTNGKGKAGQTGGNSETGAISGAPGHSVSGRTLEHWEKPDEKDLKLGTIEVKVTINPKGEIIDAKYDTGTGAAAADATTRKRCVEVSKKCKFSVATDETKVQTGTILWPIKPKNSIQ